MSHLPHQKNGQPVNETSLAFKHLKQNQDSKALDTTKKKKGRYLAVVKVSFNRIPTGFLYVISYRS